MLVEPLSFIGDAIIALSRSANNYQQLRATSTSLHGLEHHGFVCYLKQLYEKLVHLGHGKSLKEADLKGCRQQTRVSPTSG